MSSTTRIPFYSLAFMHQQIEAEVMERFQTVWKHGKFSLGPEVEEFEQSYAAFSGTRHCVGVANGYDAVMVSLRAAGLQPGDEVIVPAHTFIATWFAVTAAGGRVIPVDADAATMNMDSSRISGEMWQRARFIIPVHLYGVPCDMHGLLRTAEFYNTTVIEDNAQAQGAAIHGKSTGSFGKLGATSFYPGKNIGALGEAGAITTDNADLAAIIRKIRNVGGAQRYVHDVMGMNSRLDTLQAAFLCAKLRHLPEWNYMRQRIAAMYTERLEGIEQLRLPVVPEGGQAVWHQYVIRTSRRDALMAFLAEEGIDTLIHYPNPPHLQKAYSHLGFTRGSFPTTEEITSTCLSLPIYPGLGAEEIDRVSSAISGFFRH